MNLCKTEGCEEKELLGGLCRGCINAEYDSNHRADNPPKERIATINPDGSKKICSFCDKNRVVVSGGRCRPCYNKKNRERGLK